MEDEKFCTNSNSFSSIKGSSDNKLCLDQGGQRRGGGSCWLLSLKVGHSLPSPPHVVKGALIGTERERPLLLHKVPGYNKA